MVALRAGILQYETSAHDILLRRVAACILISRCACVRGVQPRRGCARRPVPVHTLGLSYHACSSREASAANPYHLHDKYVWNTRQIFYVMRREGIPPDVDTYTLFLMVLAADPSLGGTRLEAAGDVVLQMEAEGLELHALTYGAWMQVSLGFRVWDLGLRVQGTVQGTGLRAQGSQTSTGCKRQRARARVCWHACVRMHRRAQRARTTGAQISHTHKHTHTHGLSRLRQDRFVFVDGMQVAAAEVSAGTGVTWREGEAILDVQLRRGIRPDFQQFVTLMCAVEKQAELGVRICPRMHAHTRSVHPSIHPCIYLSI